MSKILVANVKGDKGDPGDLTPELVAARDAAVAAKTAAETAAAAAMSVPLTNDGIMAGVARDEDSEFRSELNATFAQRGSITWDGSSPYIELSARGTGAAIHLTSSTGFTGSYILGVGVDHDGVTGVLASVKADSAVGFYVALESTSGEGSHGIKGVQNATSGEALARFEMGVHGGGPLIQLHGGTSSGDESVVHVIAANGEAGEIRAADGVIAWQRSIDVRDSLDNATSRLHLWTKEGIGSALQQHHWVDKSSDTYFGATGSADLWYAARLTMVNNALKIQAGGVVGVDDPSAATWTTIVGITQDAKLGFFNATPVAKPVGVAVTPAGIHAALVALGLIGA